MGIGVHARHARTHKSEAQKPGFAPAGVRPRLELAEVEGGAAAGRGGLRAAKTAMVPGPRAPRGRELVFGPRGLRRPFGAIRGPLERPRRGAAAGGDDDGDDDEDDDYDADDSDDGKLRVE